MNGTLSALWNSLTGPLLISRRSIKWRISLIFQTVKDPFGKMLVSGSFAIFTAQVTVSIGMSLGLLPIISVSLPFMSYGALSAMINAFLFGLVLSVYHKKDMIRMKKI
ncbi:FtsW/RodA/SpoVE family cell cycle protein [Peribacillus frigoritolerans]|uniref:FtsW/RodA/SpoVE family cell cycle protein n=1 Tax=Peribacillus frigoritolerans TaxID=450367 RepID=UPI003F501E36